ncbi:hypothetical protein BC833DRAFT_316303 [Globomyces pollinis-pini]|nr:hypothetical protein BC833DRAFT_316303 [Globomyces pollinis-pini]
MTKNWWLMVREEEVTLIKDLVYLVQSKLNRHQSISLEYLREAIRVVFSNEANNISHHQAQLIDTTLIILNRLLPNHSWNQRIKLLANLVQTNAAQEAQNTFNNHQILDRLPLKSQSVPEIHSSFQQHDKYSFINQEFSNISDINSTAPYCLHHQQHLVPMKFSAISGSIQPEETHSAAFNHTTNPNYQLDSFSVESSTDSMMNPSDILHHTNYELAEMLSSWKRFNKALNSSSIKKLKSNKQWIMQEWMAATRFWSNSLLKRSFKYWLKSAVLQQNAWYFRNQNLQVKYFAALYATSSSRRKSRVLWLKQIAFKSLKNHANESVVYQINACRQFQIKYMKRTHFDVWKNKYEFRKHSEFAIQTVLIKKRKDITKKVFRV